VAVQVHDRLARLAADAVPRVVDRKHVTARQVVHVRVPLRTVLQERTAISSTCTREIPCVTAEMSLSEKT
jgi:hypothetical protein